MLARMYQYFFLAKAFHKILIQTRSVFAEIFALVGYENWIPLILQSIAVSILQALGIFYFFNSIVSMSSKLDVPQTYLQKAYWLQIIIYCMHLQVLFGNRFVCLHFVSRSIFLDSSIKNHFNLNFCIIKKNRNFFILNKKVTSTPLL